MPLIRRSKPNIRAALMALMLSMEITSPAQAHAILVDGQPKQGDAVQSGQSLIRLRYNSRIDQRRSRLTLTLPDRSQIVLGLDPADPEDVLSARADLIPGPYTLHWQVLAVDGHITRGDLAFSVH